MFSTVISFNERQRRTVNCQATIPGSEFDFIVQRFSLHDLLPHGGQVLRRRHRRVRPPHAADVTRKTVIKIENCGTEVNLIYHLALGINCVEIKVRAAIS